MKIAHIINPFRAEKGNRSYLDVAQPITFKTMVAAKNFAMEEGIGVELITCQLCDEDLFGLPRDFVKTPHLKSSVLDYNKFPGKQLALPRIYDILNSAYKNSDADYIIYTNVDIALMPNFYKKVHNLITKRNFQSIVINRVDIPKVISNNVISKENLSYAYSYSNGLWHPGKDCFVFERNAFPKMLLNNMCVGFAPIGTVLISQIFKNTEEGRFLWVTNGCLPENRMTFHIGRDQSHLDDELSDYRAYNKEESVGLIDKQFVIATRKKDLKSIGRVIL